MRGPAGSPVLSHLAIAGAYVAMTLAFVWPLGLGDPWAAPAHHDVQFSIWRLAWVAHQLVADPWRLFDANIFHPEPYTLAYSDAMLLLGVAGSPLHWAGVHPILVHNFLLLASFPAAAHGAYLLAREISASRAAAFVSGVIFAFAHYRMAHIVHLELLWTAFLPLSFLWLRRCILAPSLRAGVWLGLNVGFQALCSIYYAVLLAPALALAAAIFAAQSTDRRWKQWFACGAVSIATAAVLVAPYAKPYASARDIVGPRPIEEIMRYSATPEDFLRVSGNSRVYPERMRTDDDERALFPGILPTALSAVALLHHPVTAVPFAAVATLGLDLSLGLNGWAFPALGRAVPMVGNLRAPSRAGVIVLLAVSVLSALGLRAILQRLARRWRPGTVALAVLLCGADYWSAPIVTASFTRAPSVLGSWLATQPPGTVVAHLPMPLPHSLWGSEPDHQFHSIYHWQPMVNGYSGFPPPSYAELLIDMRDFPGPRSLAALERRGVQVVVAHSRLMQGGSYDRVVAAWASDPRRPAVIRFAQPRGEAAAFLLRPAVSPPAW